MSTKRTRVATRLATTSTPTLEPAGRLRREVQQREASRGQAQPDGEQPQPLQLVADQAVRDAPLRSVTAVFSTATLLLGSSTQSTGTSSMRRPARSARTSSSVSENRSSCR
jgi:hypothetical protein